MGPLFKKIFLTHSRLVLFKGVGIETGRGSLAVGRDVGSDSECKKWGFVAKELDGVVSGWKMTQRKCRGEGGPG